MYIYSYMAWLLMFSADHHVDWDNITIIGYQPFTQHPGTSVNH